jgi:hypothetical protein
MTATDWMSRGRSNPMVSSPVPLVTALITDHAASLVDGVGGASRSDTSTVKLEETQSLGLRRRT